VRMTKQCFHNLCILVCSAQHIGLPKAKVQWGKEIFWAAGTRDIAANALSIPHLGLFACYGKAKHRRMMRDCDMKVEEC
jgi:hypothetical protein